MAINDTCGVAFLSFVVTSIVYLWLSIKALSMQQDRDARYFEWWMRSMEERKADKPDYEDAEVDE